MKRWSLLLGLLLILLWGIPVGAEELEARGDSAMLMDAVTGEVLWEKNGAEPMAPASLIKVLNILTARPYIHWTEQVMIGPLADTVYNGQMMEINCGEIVETSELVYAMMLWSANDAAVALAEYLSGDLDLYASLMDKKAWALGAVHTVSVNVNGYSDEAQLTTAYDLAILAKAFLDDDELAAFASTKSHKLTWLYPEKTKDIQNINHFLYDYEGATGLKTGTTLMAGKCLIASATRDGKSLIAVTLNSSERYGDCAKILDYGFSASPETLELPEAPETPEEP